jgi:hypothetical protein
MVLFLTKSHIEHDFIIVIITSDDITIDEKISDTEMEKFHHGDSHQDRQSQIHAVSMLKFRSDDFTKTILLPNEETLAAFFTEK